MADKKRRVVRGPQDAIKENLPVRQDLPDYSEIVADSTADTLKDLASDTDISAERQLDQYPKLKRSQDGKVSIEAAKQVPERPSQVAYKPVQTAQGVRRAEIEDMLSKYADATKESDLRGRQIGNAATSIAFSNPAAAKVYHDSYNGYINEPVQSIEGGQRAGLNKQAMQKGVSSQAGVDEQRDPASQVTKMAKQFVKTQFGVDAPENSTAFDIKRIFPYVQTDTKRDLGERGQDFTFKTNTDNRASREREGSFNRGSREKVGAAHDKAGLGRIIVASTLGQDKADRSGSGAGQQRVANAATIPHAYAPGKYFITKPGIPPNERRAQQVTDLGGESVKYGQALQRALDLVKAAKGNPTILNKNWPAIQGAFAEATQRNIKAMGNGVANGPDIEQAIKMIGSPDDLVTWLRNGLGMKMEQAVKSIPQAYIAYADSQGFMESDKPNELTTTMGTGGSKSTQQPVNPALGTAANQVMDEYGFAPIVGQKTPETPPIPAKMSPKDSLKAKLGIK